MKSILIAAAIAAGAAMADDMVYREGGAVVRLTEAPCNSAEILDMLVPEHAQKFKAGTYSINTAHTLQLCWIAKDGAVFLVDEEGSAGPLPQSVFRREPGI